MARLKTFGDRQPFRQRDGEDAVMDLGMQGGIFQPVTEPEAELVIALGALEVEGLPVDAHEMRFARGDDQVGGSGCDIHAGGVDAGDVDGEFHGVGMILAVIAWLAKIRHGRRNFRKRQTSGRTEGMDDRVHGKMEVGTSGLVAAGLQDFLNFFR